MYNSTEDAFNMGAFETVYMTDNENETEKENENDIITDESYNDIPQWGSANSKKRMLHILYIFSLTSTETL